ncbi:unnamed protein product [Brassica napus]|uniref:(rape) hypothetical protein n=1 Tax=Brassica napus TaxID=3708 RepID=A0A816Y333_BRANA|nr:unnamed protein product [Brassica napus]
MIFVISQASTMDSEDAAPNAISFKNCSTLPGGLINGVASRIWGNKFELTAILSAYVAQQVLHSAQYSPKQRYESAKEIASSDARRLVSVTSFPAGNLPLDEVFASSLPLFIHVPISSFVLDGHFLHRTRGS